MTPPTPQEIDPAAVASRFHDEVARINLSQSSTSRFDKVKELIAPVLGIAEDEVYAAAAVTRTNNLNVRLRQTEGSERIALAFIRSVDDVDYAVEIAKRFAGSGNRYGAVAICAPDAAGRWEIRAVVESADSSFATAIKTVFPNAQRILVRASTSPSGGTATETVSKGDRHSAIPVQVDPRIKRMIRLALKTYKVVVLVGPPGSGKTQLIEEIVEEIRGNFSAFGFSTAPGPLMRRTPEESWTARDLVGGETVDDSGRLRFRPGAVLDAIRTGRWLLLDELNRADMDKIFGPLMTWLSGQDVELGRSGTAVQAATVELGWSDRPESSVERIETLSADEPSRVPSIEASSNEVATTSEVRGNSMAGTHTHHSEPVRFLAGNEWRIIGTYNPLDAQRVFRFGQALGRRMKEIPIPAATPEQFKSVLALRSPSLTPEVRSAIINLYTAHYADPATQLGPAVFLEMADYILNGIGSEFLGGLDENLGEVIESTESQSELTVSEPTEETPEAPDANAQTSLVATVTERVDENQIATSTPTALTSSEGTGSQVSALLAEAYLMNPGKYTAKYAQKILGPLGVRIVSSGALPETEWSWIKALLPGLT